VPFRITGLKPDAFIPLYGLSDADLASRGVRRQKVDNDPGFPDRIELRDIPVGGHALLLNYMHQPADTPFRATHAIFVREGATQTYDRVGDVPDVMRRRLLSLRAFDAAGMMIAADVTEGTSLDDLIARMFADPAAAYLHAHYARQGCFAARIDRA
jgi:hypothetical protein